MESDSSEDRSEERLGSYNVSADVSESETSNGEVDEDDGCSASPSAGFSSFGASSSTRLTTACSFPLVGGKDVVVWNDKPSKSNSDLSDVEMMKERFAKLLLGEDMSGGGKGVCTALAISNAITNLSASVFGALWKLEPMAGQKLAMWCREMEWFLSVSDSIVELVPSIHQSPSGGTYEIMATRQRADLYMNLPALKKLDAMLISILGEFQNTEFWYVDGGMDADDCHKRSSELFCERPSVRQEGKWWLPCPQVPGRGLSEDSRKMLQQSRDCANQILKAAMAINSNVLAEMDIPTTYIENLPKNGRDCLGDILYNHVTADQFSPQHILDSQDLSSEHNALEVANKLEAAVHVWKLKERKKQPDIQRSKRNSWGGKVKGFAAGDGEKNQLLVQRAVTLLSSLRHRFPGLPQTALDMSKIQYNKDVGHSILESYSRVMESLAFNIIARIDDVLYVDNATRCSVAAESLSIFNRVGGFNGLPVQKRISPSPFSIQPTPYSSPPFATPFGLSPPIPSSPTRTATLEIKADITGHQTHKLDKVVPSDLSNLWLYAGHN